MPALSFDYMNAAGWAKTPEQVLRLAKIPLITHIVIGSFTVPPREGNQGGTTFVVLPDGTGGNAVGLRNKGRIFLKTEGPEMVRVAHDAGKKLVVSGAWFQPEELGQLAETACEIGADIFESNDGCPNVWDGGKQKAIPSYDLELMSAADFHVRHLRNDIVLWKKLSPYVNPQERAAVAHYLSTDDIYAGVTTSNTLPNVRLRQVYEPVITAEGTNGLCGVSGTGLKLLALANAENFRELLPPHMKVIGVGGIRSRGDIEDYLRVGCAGVQVGTVCFLDDKVEELQRIGVEWLSHYYA